MPEANNGMRTALVLTGVATASDAERSPIRADYVWGTLERLAELIRGLIRPSGRQARFNTRLTCV